jgi:hypothetical protein
MRIGAVKYGGSRDGETNYKKEEVGITMMRIRK